MLGLPIEVQDLDSRLQHDKATSNTHKTSCGTRQPSLIKNKLNSSQFVVRDPCTAVFELPYM